MNVGEGGLLQLQDMALENSRVERRKLAPKLSLVISQERVRVALEGLWDPSDLEIRRDEANTANQAARGAVGQQTQTVSDLEQKLKDARSACDALGNFSELAIAELPAGPIQAESEAKELDATVEREDASHREHASQATAAERKRDEATRAAASLDKDASFHFKASMRRSSEKAAPGWRARYSFYETSLSSCRKQSTVGVQFPSMACAQAAA
jgi:hypothetical protein